MASLFVLSACSGEDPTSTGGSDAKKQKEAAASALADVRAELEGLDLDARRDKLIELAKAEIDDEHPLTLYAGSSLMPDMVDLFTEETGIEVEILTTGGNTSAASRIQTEVDAGVVGADVTDLGDQFLEGEKGFVAQGYTLPMDSPYEADIQEASKGDEWTGVYLNQAIPVWNTDTVKTAPTSWRDMFETYGLDKEYKFGFEIEDVQWFANVVEILEDEGMTEDEAIQLFKDAAQGNPFTRGSTVALQLVAAGEFDVHTNTNFHRIVELQGDGAPLEWKPTPNPVLYYNTALAIISNTDNPAGVQLLVDFMISPEGQAVVVDTGRSPVNKSVDDPFPWEEVEPHPYDFALQDDPKWDELWQEVIDQGVISESR